MYTKKKERVYFQNKKKKHPTYTYIYIYMYIWNHFTIIMDHIKAWHPDTAAPGDSPPR